MIAGHGGGGAPLSFLPDTAAHSRARPLSRAPSRARRTIFHGFGQVLTSVGKVYRVPWPSAYAVLLGVLSGIVNLNIFRLFPIECFLGSDHNDAFLVYFCVYLAIHAVGLLRLAWLHHHAAAAEAKKSVMIWLLILSNLLCA